MANEFPEYRVRLFLSVDLVGSTQLKNKSKNNKEWVKIFQTFYKQFPDTLKKEYEDISRNRTRFYLQLSDEEKQAHPKLWKTIGDEILFCCSLKSLVHLSVCMTAFINSLIEYGDILKNSEELNGSLSTKGNAWVASFPTPNCSISLSDISNESVVSEKIEEKADNDPSKFDFLGKGIDAGFRISKFSSENNFTISPGLGVLLCECFKEKRSIGFSHEVTFIKQESLKGVVNDNPYPILVIDTCRDDEQKQLFKLEKDFLKTPDQQNPDQLSGYLKKYLNYHEIEIPVLRISHLDNNWEPPIFYNEYKMTWENEMEQENEKIREWKNEKHEKSESEVEQKFKTSDSHKKLEKKLEALVEGQKKLTKNHKDIKPLFGTIRKTYIWILTHVNIK